MQEEREYKCEDCFNQGSPLCRLCTFRQSPSGKTSRPLHFRTFEDSLIQINISRAKIPPLGLKPKYVHDEERALDIAKAIARRLQCGMEVPIEWVEEYNSLRTQDKEKQEAKSKPQ